MPIEKKSKIVFLNKDRASQKQKAELSQQVHALNQELQIKYFDAKYKIREFELQILDIQKRGGTPEQLQELRLKMEALLNREKSWIGKLMNILQPFPRKKKTQP